MVQTGMIDELYATTEMRYRNRFTLPAAEKRAALLAELADEQRSAAPRPARRAFRRWLGERLVAAGERLGSGRMETPRPRPSPRG
jgi:hypothetical protein